MYQTSISVIAALAEERAAENDNFRMWLRVHDDEQLDETVHRINDKVSAGIDCTACANCCKSFMINVAPAELKVCAEHFQVSEDDFKEKYLEESLQGKLYINTIPCHFLTDNKCTIYTSRFADCREFPHLHKPGFNGRLLGTLLHYGRCPIVYNVLEELKDELGYQR